MTRKSFEAVDVLRLTGDTELSRYRCFRILPADKYWVEAVDRYSLPLSSSQKENLTEQARVVLEGVAFAAGSETNGLGELHDSLDEAIMAFEGNYSR